MNTEANVSYNHPESNVTGFHLADMTPDGKFSMQVHMQYVVGSEEPVGRQNIEYDPSSSSFQRLNYDINSGKVIWSHPATLVEATRLVHSAYGSLHEGHYDGPNDDGFDLAESNVKLAISALDNLLDDPNAFDSIDNETAKEIGIIMEELHGTST